MKDFGYFGRLDERFLEELPTVLEGTLEDRCGSRWVPFHNYSSLGEFLVVHNL